LGAGVGLAGANKAFYRVVAVDAADKRSGPSDYAAAPRPVIFSKPMGKVQTGVRYYYDVRATRSLGDLRTRVVDGREVMNYWDVEKPRFELEKGPKSENHKAAIAIGVEGINHATKEILIENNSFFNRGNYETLLVWNATAEPAMLRGNKLTGQIEPLRGDGEVQ
jgi:hypothetical protein